jgi:hypothetical protein
MRLTELSPFVGRTCLWFMVFNATFNNIADIVAVSFIDGGKRATWRKPPTFRKNKKTYSYFILLLKIACNSFSY